MGAKRNKKPNTAAPKSFVNPHFWLLLSENPDKVNWPPTVKIQKWQVSILNSPTLQGCQKGGMFRTSPVFAVSEDFRIPDFTNGTLYLCFFCFDPAFPVLGRLRHMAPKALLSGLLYTSGLASILLITRDLKMVDRLEELAKGQARSKEIWTVSAGTIQEISCRCAAAEKFDSKQFELRRYDALPLVPKTTVDEFVANLAALVPKIALHVPSELDTYIRLVRLVNELVTEMAYVSSPRGKPPSTLEEYTEAGFADASLCARILHQNTDRLIQINSALSYVSTQALSGAVPILDRRSLIRRYSLLGIGTATLALTRIAHSIERAFARGAIEDILEKRAVIAPALPGLDKLPTYDASRWKDFSIDTLNGNIPAREPFPKLPYFSGRLGFREAEYTVSAALQSLVAGAGPEWSLLTLTHEMVHGHVRNMLSVLFQGDANRTPSLKWQEFYDRFAHRVLKKPIHDERLSDSLRAVILFYCCKTATHGSLTKDVFKVPDLAGKTRIPVKIHLLKQEELWLTYEAEYRNISEVFVHILDLHYFYCSSVSHYIPLIWRSWSRLPQVRADIRQYLLRTLLVMAATLDGDEYDRFTVARARCAELIDSIKQEQGVDATVINDAANKLRGDYAEKNLFFPFAGSLILVDVVDRVLTDSGIRGALNAGDKHFSLKKAELEEWLAYDMPDIFVDDVIVSPTAYLADRLSRISGSHEDTLEAKTAAIFLACASHVEKGASNAPKR
jgi:hypothetical protein